MNNLPAIALRDARHSYDAAVMSGMSVDTASIDTAVLTLLYLTEHEHKRAWRGCDWGALDQLYERDLITDPRNKARSAILTEDGWREAERLYKRHLEHCVPADCETRE
ncbi:DUF6429 family protein [Paraburkholderia megapolitana]|uniref:DUF6429 family protein n=1 Tax=Paraburkholderia TaxID=1822464 RepID=UPI0027E1206A|nr:DUF6429 family protein [Paraburkholderia megapolitana]